MSLEKIHLRKLMQIFYASDRKRISILRDDIRSEIRKEQGIIGDGGDFHGPFWTDAKRHVEGMGDLSLMTAERVKANAGRARLYPQLERGFLAWWNEKRRWRNEPVEVFEGVKKQFPISDTGGIVKVENMLAMKVGPDFRRIVYPYFAEIPALSEEAARVGLWVIGQALPEYQQDAFRVLDVLRGASFGTPYTPFKGNERTLFFEKYRAAKREWQKLRKEYD